MTANQRCNCENAVFGARDAGPCGRFFNDVKKAENCDYCGHDRACHPPANQEGEKCSKCKGDGYTTEPVCCQRRLIGPHGTDCCMNPDPAQVQCNRCHGTGLEPSTPTAEPEGELEELLLKISRMEYGQRPLIDKILTMFRNTRRPLDDDAIRAEFEKRVRSLWDVTDDKFHRLLTCDDRGEYLDPQMAANWHGYRLATKRGEG